MEDYLIHHGIKGMKWGVRRFQNEDGSLTSAGRKRYAAIEAASRTANTYANYAKSDREKWQVQLEGKSKRVSGVKDSDLKRWIATSSKQEAAYKEIFDHYKNMRVEDIDRKTIKEAERFTKSFFTNADYSDYYSGGKWHNYQLDGPIYRSRSMEKQERKE